MKPTICAFALLILCSLTENVWSAKMPCDQPYVLDAVATHNAVFLHWKNVKGVIEYQVAGRAAQSETWVLFSTTLNSIEIHHLKPQTAYEWGVRAKCESSDWTDWHGPGNFTTLSGPIDTTIKDPLMADSKPIVTIYSNPTEQITTVEIFSNSKVKEATVRMKDAMGNLIYLDSISNMTGLDEFEIQTGALAAGMYHVSIVADQFLEQRSIYLSR